jgi:hypothetical protein
MTVRSIALTVLSAFVMASPATPPRAIAQETTTVTVTLVRWPFT